MSCCLESSPQSLPASQFPQLSYQENELRQTPRDPRLQISIPPPAVFVPPQMEEINRNRPLPPGCKAYSLLELRQATGNFSPDALLGEGGFGKVYRGALDDGTSVAIKVLDRRGLQGDREFEVEINVLARLRHRNLVTLRGACTQDRNRMAVFDFMPGGSLRDNLDRRRQSIYNCQAPRTNLLWPARIHVALGAAKGLRFLHEGIEPGMIHRDIKASNVLLDDSGHARIADFGLAIHTADKSGPEAASFELPPAKEEDIRGAYGYLAPETSDNGVMSQKSDVYGFGVVLLELLTGLDVVDPHLPQGQQLLVDRMYPILTKDYPDVDQLKRQLDPIIPPDSVPIPQLMWFCEVAAGCLHPTPSKRLRMSEVVAYLSKLDSWKEVPAEVRSDGRRISTSDRTENGRYTLASLMDDEPMNVPPVREGIDLIPTVTLLQAPQTSGNPFAPSPPASQHLYPVNGGVSSYNPYPPAQGLPQTVHQSPDSRLSSPAAHQSWPTMPSTPPSRARPGAGENAEPNLSRGDMGGHLSLEHSPTLDGSAPILDATYSPLRTSITGKPTDSRHNMDAYANEAQLSKHSSPPVGPLQDGLQSHLDRQATHNYNFSPNRRPTETPLQPEHSSTSWISFGPT